MPESLPQRKKDHIRINLNEDVQSRISTGLDRYQFIHQALPEINLMEVDTQLELFGKVLSAPVLISSMTGGTDLASRINRILAEAAQKTGIAMGLGSQRAGMENPQLASTFKVRDVAPDILLFANLGAVQLNYGYTADDCQRAVDMVGADGLFLHLNALQEALQPEGNPNYSGLLQKIERVCKLVKVPVVVKEVGWGISEKAARQLIQAGVSGVDVAGAGGTSWSQVEMYRIEEPHLARVAAAFRSWGIPTVESIINVRKQSRDFPVFASGGIRDGIEIAKCIALGATLAGMASPFLKAADHSQEETISVIEEIKQEIRICMFAVGTSSLNDLRDNRALLFSLGHP